jgi:hypothetical protein
MIKSLLLTDRFFYETKSGDYNLPSLIKFIAGCNRLRPKRHKSRSPTIQLPPNVIFASVEGLTSGGSYVRTITTNLYAMIAWSL